MPATLALVTTQPGGAQSLGELTEPRYGKSDGPLVSCLMVTKGERASLGAAIECYRRQSYANRELVIVCDHSLDAMRAAAGDDPTIRIVAAERATLGELRNRAVAEARGDYVCQWDDDDLSDPGRIELQLAALEAAGTAASFLLRWLIWWPDLRRAAASSVRLWEGTILIRKDAILPYPALPIGEDFEMVARLRETMALAGVDAPASYVYAVHGANTCPDDHFETLWANATARFESRDYAMLIAALGQRLPIADWR